MSQASDNRPTLDRLVARLFDDEYETRFGSGWASGTIAVFLGVLSAGAVACFHLPAALTSPSVRAVYALNWIRPLVATVIGAAFFFGLLSALLRRRKVLGFTGMGLALIASLLGGASVEVTGVDVFLLALVFVPMERVFAQRPSQSTFRPGWTTDVVHFFVSHLLVQMASGSVLARSSTGS